MRHQTGANPATDRAVQSMGPLLAAGVSLMGTGTALMFYGGQKIAIGSDGRQITVRVRF